MILAAGLGSRLRPLTAHIPKPCVPFLGEPLIERSLRRVQEYGAIEAVVNGSYQVEELENTLRDTRVEGLHVHLSKEEVRLGTGGGIARARQYIEEESEVLIINGDVVSSMDLAALLRAHRSNGAWMTLAVTLRPDLSDTIHKIVFDDSGAVLEVDGVHAATSNSVEMRRGIYTGTVVLSSEALQQLPEGREACLKEEGFWPALRQGRNLRVWRTQSFWEDIGTPQSYLAAQFQALNTPELIPPGYTRMGPHQYVHPLAQIGENVSLDGPCLIGPGAKVDSGAHLNGPIVMGRNSRIATCVQVSRIVLWEGACIRGEVPHNSICREDDVLTLGPT